MQTADQINLAIAVISAFSTLMSLAVVVATFKILQVASDVTNKMTILVVGDHDVTKLAPVARPGPESGLWHASAHRRRLELSWSRPFANFTREFWPCPLMSGLRYSNFCSQALSRSPQRRERGDSSPADAGKTFARVG